jgi:hypothetical protein
LKRSVNAMRSAFVSCSAVISASISDTRRLKRSSVCTDTDRDRGCPGAP